MKKNELERKIDEILMNFISGNLYGRRSSDLHNEARKSLLDLIDQVRKEEREKITKVLEGIVDQNHMPESYSRSIDIDGLTEDLLEYLSGQDNDES